MLHMIEHVFIEQSLVAAFAVVGAVMWVSLVISRRLTAGRVHGSAIAIVMGLGLAYVGGLVTGGQKGLADIPVFAGIGLMGGAMLRDFAIVATAFEVDAIEARRAGLLGVVSLGLGTILPFIVGGLVAAARGGPIVLIAGLGAVSICFACVALISRLGGKRELPPEEVAEIERGGYVIGGDTPPDYASPAPGREPALAPHPVSSAKA